MEVHWKGGKDNRAKDSHDKYFFKWNLVLFGGEKGESFIYMLAGGHIVNCCLFGEFCNEKIRIIIIYPAQSFIQSIIYTPNKKNYNFHIFTEKN